DPHPGSGQDPTPTLSRLACGVGSRPDPREGSTPGGTATGYPVHMHRPVRLMVLPRGASLVALLLSLCAIATAGQRPGVHPISGREYALPMGVQGAPWLDRRERDEEEEPDRALRILKLP